MVERIKKPADWQVGEQNAGAWMRDSQDREYGALPLEASCNLTTEEYFHAIADLSEAQSRILKALRIIEGRKSMTPAMDAGLKVWREINRTKLILGNRHFANCPAECPRTGDLCEGGAI